MNLVFKDKPGVLIVDLPRLVDQFERALASYTGSGGANAYRMDNPAELREFTMNADGIFQERC